jgi:DNA-binding response OmpR family regulator
MSQQILVVDDEAPMRDLLAVFLTRAGYQVTQAASEAETVRLVNKQAIDLVVLDIGLGGEDGLKLLTTLKTQHPSLRVVMLTGMGFVEDLLQEASQKGADGYVSKAIPMEELVLAIRRVLKPPTPTGKAQG